MNKRYVSPNLITEEVKHLKRLAEYNYFDGGISEEDDKQIDQLTMDDFNSAKDGAPEGGAPPQGGAPAGGAPPAPEGGAPAGGAPPAGEPKTGEPPADPFGAAAGGNAETAPPDAGGEPTEEVDVTDIVQGTKDVQQKTDDMSGKVEATMQKVDALVAKLGGMEASVGKMGQALSKIDAIYKELELMKPPSPEEVKAVMADKSYPFNVQLKDYGKDGTPRNQTELEQKKNKLSLANLLNDFNERDVRQSFNPPDPFADKMSQSMPGYRI